MIKWKCKHTTTKSAKKCLDIGHRDCLEEMCERNSIVDIEKFSINFNKHNVDNRYNNCSVDILAYLCELGDLETVKILIEKYKYNQNRDNQHLRGGEYLLSSVCYGKNFSLFLYVYNNVLKDVNPDYLTWPCIYGNLDILQYILNDLYKSNSFTQKESKIQDKIQDKLENGIFHAITRNHINVIKFLFNNYDIEIEERNLKCYAKCANYSVWKFLLEKKKLTITNEILNFARKYNNDSNVYVLMSNYCIV